MSKNIYISIAIVISLNNGLVLSEMCVEELFKEHKQTQVKQQAFICKGNSFVEYNDSKYGQSFRYYDFEFGTDSERIGSTIRKYKLESRDETIEPDRYSMKTNYVWDGSRRFEYKRSVDNVGRAVIRDSEEHKQRHISIGYPGAPLMGIFYGDMIKVSEVIQDVQDVKIRGEQERVADSLCYIIDATTKHGQYTLWIDPEHGFNIAKATVIKNENDLAWGLELNKQKKKSFSYSISNVQFEAINGIWTPIHADYEYVKEFSDGETETAKGSITVNEYSIDPDFETLETFKPKIDNGAAVYLNKQGIKYVWMDGELVPNIDRVAMEALEEEVENLKIEEGISIPEKPQKVVAEPIIPEVQEVKNTKQQQGVSPKNPTEDALVAKGDFVKDITAEELLEKMLECRARVENLQFIAEYHIHNAIYGEAFAEQTIKSMKEKGATEQQIKMIAKTLGDVPEYRYQTLKCTIDNLEHAKIERTDGTSDSLGAKVTSEGKSISSWNGVSGVDFNQRKGLPGFASVKDTAPTGASKQGQPWRTFTGTFIDALSKAIASGGIVTVNKLEDGTYHVDFEDDTLKRIATIDPSQGYSCTLEEYYRQEHLSHRRTSKYEEVANGVWFPVYGDTISYTSDGSVRRKSNIVTSEVKINDPDFNLSYFEVDFPEGTEVRDAVQGKKYVVGSDRTYELPETQKSTLKDDTDKDDNNTTTRAKAGVIEIPMSCVGKCDSNSTEVVQQIIGSRLERLQNLTVNYEFNQELTPSPSSMKKSYEAHPDGRGFTFTPAGSKKMQKSFFFLNGKSRFESKEVDVNFQNVPEGIKVPYHDLETHVFSGKKAERLVHTKGEDRYRGTVGKISYPESVIDLALGLKFHGDSEWITSEKLKSIDYIETDKCEYIYKYATSRDPRHEWSFDKKNGCALTSYRIYDSENKLFREVTMESFKNIDGLMLPFKVTSRIFCWLESGQPHVTNKISLNITQYKLNDPENISEKYKIEWPDNTLVIDRRTKMPLFIQGGGVKVDDSIHEDALTGYLDQYSSDSSNKTHTGDSSVFIPNISVAQRKNKPFIFDLASGKLQNSDLKVDSEKACNNLLKLGKGDIAWDGSLVTVRKAKAMTVQKESHRPLKSMPGKWCNRNVLPEKVDTPYSVLVTSNENKKFLVTVRKIEDDGIRISYKNLSSDEVKDYLHTEMKKK